MICDECETVAHCMKNGCVPKQNSVDRLLDEAKLLADDRPVEVEGLPEWAIDAEHTIRRLVKALSSQPAQRQRSVKPLTDEEMYLAIRPLFRTDAFANAALKIGKDEYRAIEAATNIKENTCAALDELCTTPPQRKPLTDEEIEQIWRLVQANDFHDCVQPFARAIEAKLKEKNSD